MINNYEKRIIAFFYLFDLFGDIIIISISCDNIQYSGNKSLKTIINNNLKYIEIIIFLNMFLDIII